MCVKNKRILLLQDSYFTSHSSALLYVMPRLDTNIDDTSQRLALLSKKKLLKYVTDSSIGQFVISNVTFEPKISQTKPKILINNLKITKSYTWISFNNIALSDNGILYVYHRKTPKKRVLTSDTKQNDLNY